MSLNWKLAHILLQVAKLHSLFFFFFVGVGFVLFKKNLEFNIYIKGAIIHKDVLVFKKMFLSLLKKLLLSK